MSQYKRGADFERRVALYYGSLGFDVIELPVLTVYLMLLLSYTVS